MKTTFTIDNAIARFEKVAANYEFNLDMHQRNVMKLSVNDIERMKEYIQENRQMAEWLRELKKLKSEDAVNSWIPIKWHEITKEEREREGYPEEWGIIYDSRLPEDGTDTLIQTKWGIDIAPFCEDESGAYWEQYETPGDVIAWQPLPEPYEEGSGEE